MPAPALHLNEETQKAICAQLENGYPNEAGGFLLGDGALPDPVYIREAIAVTNQFDAAEQHHRYAMSPQDWLRYEDEAEARGLRLLGYYHSHPDSPAIPSDYDRQHALPHFIYLIASVRQRQSVELRAWQLDPDRHAFTELPVRVAQTTSSHMACS